MLRVPATLSLSLSLSLVHVCCYPVSSSPFRVFETVTSEDRVSGSSSCTRARYRHSFVYLKFPANPRESGSPRKRHATTYSPDRRTNVRPSRCVGSCMDNFITCIEAMLVCAYVCVCIYIYIREWRIYFRFRFPIRIYSCPCSFACNRKNSKKFPPWLERDKTIPTNVSLLPSFPLPSLSFLEEFSVEFLRLTMLSDNDDHEYRFLYF